MSGSSSTGSAWPAAPLTVAPVDVGLAAPLVLAVACIGNGETVVTGIATPDGGVYGSGLVDDVDTDIETVGVADGDQGEGNGGRVRVVRRDGQGLGVLSTSSTVLSVCVLAKGSLNAVYVSLRGQVRAGGDMDVPSAMLRGDGLAVSAMSLLSSSLFRGAARLPRALAQPRVPPTRSSSAYVSTGTLSDRTMGTAWKEVGVLRLGGDWSRVVAATAAPRWRPRLGVLNASRSSLPPAS